MVLLKCLAQKSSSRSAGRMPGRRNKRPPRSPDANRRIEFRVLLRSLIFAPSARESLAHPARFYIPLAPGLQQKRTMLFLRQVVKRFAREKSRNAQRTANHFAALKCQVLFRAALITHDDVELRAHGLFDQPGNESDRSCRCSWPNIWERPWLCARRQSTYRACYCSCRAATE